jgi:hypothetical protein
MREKKEEDREKLEAISRQVRTLQEISMSLKQQIEEDGKDLEFGEQEARSLLARARTVTARVRNTTAGGFSLMLWMAAIFVVFVILYYLLL